MAPPTPPSVFHFTVSFYAYVAALMGQEGQASKALRYMAEEYEIRTSSHINRTNVHE